MAPVKYQLGQFPPDNIDWKQLVPLLSEANRELSRYDTLLEALPNAEVLLPALMLWEGVSSSRIEGIDISMTEVLTIGAGTEPSSQTKQLDAEEVDNHNKALQFIVESLSDRREFSLHMLREAHERLMSGVRGQDKQPGAFRKNQNWIGRPGSSIEEASFISIPPEQLDNGMDKWLEYFRSDKELDKLAQIAILHLEFEALHPFADGNGRIGRMLIPLFLHVRGVMRHPVFYMSDYLAKRRAQYIDAMQEVSRSGAWTEWCLFFLRGVSEQAQTSYQKVQEILTLQESMRRAIAEITRSQYADLVVDFIFSFPVFVSTEFCVESAIPRRTATRILKALRDANILCVMEKGSGSRPAVIEFPSLLRVMEQ